MARWLPRSAEICSPSASCTEPQYRRYSSSVGWCPFGWGPLKWSYTNWACQIPGFPGLLVDCFWHPWKREKGMGFLEGHRSVEPRIDPNMWTLLVEDRLWTGVRADRSWSLAARARSVTDLPQPSQQSLIRRRWVGESRHWRQTGFLSKWPTQHCEDQNPR